jgi:hypothetical protein
VRTRSLLCDLLKAMAMVIRDHGGSLVVQDLAASDAILLLIPIVSPNVSRGVTQVVA